MRRKLCIVIAMMCIIAGMASAEEQMTIKLGATAAASMEHPEYASLVKFKEVVEQESDGRLLVELYPASQLGKTSEMIEGTSMGTIEACNVGFDSVVSVYPPVAIFSLPYLFEDISHVRRVLQSEAGQQVLDKMIADVNLRLVGVLYRGPRHLMSSKKAVFTPEDLNGQQIRVPGNPLNQETLKAMGATPVAVDWSEIYTALSQKLVDGYENPIDIFYESKGHETMKYLSFTGHMQSPIPIFVNEQFYQKLAPELQEAVMKGGKAAEEHRLELLESSETRALKVFKEAGIEINEVDFAAFQEATKDVYKKFVDKFGEDTYQAIKAVE